MKKIFSICIPSYNMEEYLSRCVDSMIIEEVLDQLEIIIVNDGSKDGTLSIANDFKKRYPQSVVVIDKPNAHYGSCVNAALKVATGKYFRIVDADDWVDSKALTQLVNRLNKIDVDCVWTKFSTHYPGSERIEDLDVPYDVTLDLNEYVLPHECLHMHSLIYATDLLHRINYSQTEGICYTDMEYVYIPLSCSQTIYFMDVCLYHYIMGRDGQSMDNNIVVKNNDHFLKIIRRIYSIHSSSMPFNRNELNIFSGFIKFTMLLFAIPHYILKHKYNNEKETLYRSIYGELLQLGKLEFPVFLGANKIRMVKFWYKSGKLSRFIMWPFKIYYELFAVK